jgi:hypothetical protein
MSVCDGLSTAHFFFDSIFSHRRSNIGLHRRIPTFPSYFPQNYSSLSAALPIFASSEILRAVPVLYVGRT